MSFKRRVAGAQRQGRDVSWWGRLFGERRDAALPLYNAVVTQGRAEHWYVAGGVPDTVDGRFDMIAAVLTMVLLRLEAEPDAAALQAHLTERFVDDMDGQLRQMGIGDIVVGKHIGKMMSMLGGRLGAYRDGLAAGDLTPALVRNLYRGATPAPAAVAHVADALTAMHVALATAPLDRLTAGELA
ncbi:ubiquinol-cytochrome C chaperone family protein [Sphingomonadaceae bacterium OTU29MARTA1]|uniref:ubiquinol-cytochrome C chaperone family protein n=1 Tax=Sphingomonas sp. Leaf37 TaxID=2876552 RepID=UPI001E348174|nr:ubiquinol-cytochrome C chaperone family protein [Sphingomonas sp. Leaf37]USU03694.1 ubiquinol-cytochrome C chaperone family protein [Sphingomonadaceae bacterium OTU29LAMAA1]USU07445.1 ubiquinol-cytochrome C chaperone family protein [Sphingomonadaceae bacterium OTU29MARTA1]USU10938.1 ubiquinol-cytochrome C chaperone family protein [Sphingomonadaceae bacterium OTU29THOMA1]